MKGIYIVLCTILLSCPVFAQEYALELYDWFSVGDTVYLSNGGHLRESGSRNAKSIAKLSSATSLIINGEPTEARETIYNLSGKYYPVKYFNEKGTFYGYVWQGLLAKATARGREGNLFLYGWKSFNPDNNILTYTLTRVAEGEQKLEVVWSDTISYHTSYEAKVLNGMGLTGVKNIFRVGMLGEACGVATVYSYFAWDGKKFYRLPEKMSVGDAGVYGYYEELSFPAEHKMGKDVIIIKSTEVEYEELMYKELPGQYFTESTEVIKYRMYKWSGTTYELIKQEDID